MTTNPATTLKKAFSLIEIMVAVALLAVIVLGLIAMFDQTRRAFATGLSQGDYTESARVALDMMAREVEQMRPTGNPGTVNFYVEQPANFTPRAWPLVAPTDTWTNTLQRLFFVTRYNRQWSVIGYHLDVNGMGQGVGTLYRCSSNIVSLDEVNAQLSDFTNYVPSLSLYRIIDGVVDFRIRAYDTNGVLVGNNPPSFDIRQVGTAYEYKLYNNAVPAYVELELAVLEDRSLERYRSLTNNMANAAAFLTNRAARVHIFRQRVPIRGMDPAAYRVFP